MLKLAEMGEIDKDERVVCICTGHVLKDPDTIIKSFGKVHQAKADLASVKACISAKD
jgi:threonine synthase